MLKRLVVFYTLLLTPFSSSWAISFTPFGPHGEGGFINGQTFFFNDDGAVFELDAFLNIEGLDLNGGAIGTSAQFSFDPLPPGLTFDFSPSLSSDLTDLNLTYTFSNTTTEAFPNIKFFSFLDTDIAESISPFNEFGQAFGTIGSGAADSAPDSWEIDEPGFLFGDIFVNLLLGTLDNTNAIPQTFPEDVSMALGFDLGNLNPLETITVDIFLSEDSDFIGDFFLTQEDLNPLSLASITMSGQSSIQQNSIPEPNTWLLLTTGLIALGGILTKKK
ncbi:protein of unknown function DUF1555 [Nitrosococcus halophilus Nc 4]|uniref:PEP-CTERM protein-sorting domain-containing protein n=1 Tax=Nitrosococcus halophilus (strain Nc4) TaxID=472759 RepID=D5C545_NITHN|nr:PEP-CTERM sorting domain-containing protein [Nitrosococcus halophilus]ADE15268.1 protein of unknown function DUF1555 [Nitrosococcus halophilus Nc 4]